MYIDGALVMAAAPTGRHQDISHRLTNSLGDRRNLPLLPRNRDREALT